MERNTGLRGLRSLRSLASSHVRDHIVSCNENEKILGDSHGPHVWCAFIGIKLKVALVKIYAMSCVAL